MEEMVVIQLNSLGQNQVTSRSNAMEEGLWFRDEMYFWQHC